MANAELISLLNTFADILDMQSVEWKPIAYRRAARSIESLSLDVSVIYQRGGIKALKEIPGVGDAIAHKIEEFLATGKVKEFEKVQKSIPRGLLEVMRIQGMGPKKAWKLHVTLKITSVRDLETAAQKGKIRTLEGFGEKSEQDILRGIGLLRGGKERRLLGEMLPLARMIKHDLEQHSFVEHVDIAGSLRRMRETIRDIDFLVISDQPKNVMKFFTTMSHVKTVLSQGPTRSSVVLKQGVNCDLRVLEKKNYGAGLQYFSGSKEHAVALRTYAVRKGYKLSEYGLFKKTKTKEHLLPTKTEEDIYKTLGMDYIPPEIRENQGEIEAALHHALPKLISYDALKGDLHMHTTWSDGNNTAQEMIDAAAKKGYSYLAITDHSKSLRIGNGLDEQRLLQHIKEIHTIAENYPKVHVLTGSEVDILADGTLDYSDALLKKLDFVVASVHSRFKSSSDVMTKRILKALDNPYVRVLGHPFGRKIHERESYQFDFNKVLNKALDKNVAFEVNAFPERLDLQDSYIRQVVKAGGTICINTDSHAPSHLDFMEYGLGQARRGWAEEKHVVNAWRWEQFRKFAER